MYLALPFPWKIFIKTITAIIRPTKFSDVKDALFAAGIELMTVTSVMGCGHQEGYEERWWNSSVEVNLLNRTRIEIVVPDEKVKPTMDVIVEKTRTGSMGDGKIFVMDVPQYMSISTGN
jgi:nitrogen regulatory protein PII